MVLAKWYDNTWEGKEAKIYMNKISKNENLSILEE